jgi:hypothetical protein
MAFSVFDHSIVQQGQLIMTVMTPDRRLGDNSVLNEQHERVQKIFGVLHRDGGCNYNAAFVTP